MKFAFIMNVKGTSPETYSTVYETAGRYNLIAGVDGTEAAEAYIKKLAEEGFDKINLSGDFDEEFAHRMAEQIAAGISENTEIKCTRYILDELMKLQFIDSFRDYGLIIIDENVNKYHDVVLRSPVRDTRISFVQNLKHARHAVIRQIEKRVNVIDLCDWFDMLRLDNILKTAGNRAAVGTCGEIDLMKIK